MKNSRKLFLTAFAAVTVLLGSCQKDSTLYYNDICLAVVQGKNLLTDYGVLYHIEEMNCEVSLDTLDRVIVVSDLLSRSDDGGYNIRLNGIARVLTREVVREADLADPSTMGSDPVNINNLWFSGGFLNIQYSMLSKGRADKGRDIDLLWETNTASDTLKFTFCHNSKGDCYNDPLQQNLKDFDLHSAYVSIPCSVFVNTTTGDSFPIRLKWKWYNTESGQYEFPLVDLETSGTVEK